MNVVLKSGKIREKPKSTKKQKEEYVRIVTGLAFFLSSQVFNYCPSVNKVVVSGYTQRISKKTGNLEDEYVYSIVIDKETFGKINFQSADPVEAFHNFEVRCKISTSREMAPITPYATEEVSG